MTSRVRIFLLGEPSSLERAFARAGAAERKFEGQTIRSNRILKESFAGLQKGVGGSLAKLDAKRIFAAGAAGGAGFLVAQEGARILGEQLRESVHGAIQLQKSGEAINATFGASAESVKKFTESADSLGLSAKDAQQLAAKIGILFHNIGIGSPKAAEMTENMLRLGSAIARVKGINTAEALQNLPLVLAGNLRGLKQMGFAFTQAQIKNEAFRLGLVKTTKQGLLPAAKAEAIYELAIKQLGFFEQNAAAHSGDLFNKQQKLSAQWSNMQDKLGGLLIPALSKLVGGLSKGIDGASAFAGAIKRVGDTSVPVVGNLKQLALWAGAPEIKGAAKLISLFSGGGGPPTPTAAQTGLAKGVIAAAGGLPPLPGQPSFAARLAAGGFNAANRPSKAGGVPLATRPSRALRLAEYKALLTKTLADDLKVARLEEDFLRKQLKGTAGEPALQEEILQGMAAYHVKAEAIANQIADEQQRHANALKAAAAKAARTRLGAAKAAEALGKAILGALPRVKHEGLVGGLFGTKGKAAGPLTPGYTAASSHKLTEGLGLSRDQRVELEQRYAQAGMHHGRVPVGTAALGQPIEITLNLDGKVVSKVVLDYLRGKTKHGAASTRGGVAGSYLGLH